MRTLKSVLSILLLGFSSLTLGDEPPASPQQTEFWNAIRADNLPTVKTLIKQYSFLGSGPCGNGDPAEIAAAEGAMNVLRYLGARADQSSKDCAFRRAIYENRMAAVRYFTEELKISKVPLYVEAGFYNISSTSNVEVMEYLLEHYKLDRAELDKTYTEAVFYGEPAMVELIRKQGALFLNPTKAISLFALSINNGTGLGKNPLLSFAIATEKPVTLKSKSQNLKPLWPKKADASAAKRVNWKRVRGRCPTPLLLPMDLASQVNSYELNKAGCDATIFSSDRTWNATIYASTVLYEGSEPYAVQAASDRLNVPIHVGAQSGLWAHWIENNVQYLMGFECLKEGDTTCLTTEKVQKVIADLRYVKQPR